MFSGSVRANSVIEVSLHGVLIAQNLAGPGLYPVHRLLKHLGVGHRAQHDAVHFHHVGGGVDSGHNGGHADDGGCCKEVQRADEPLLTRCGGVQPVLHELQPLLELEPLLELLQLGPHTGPVPAGQMKD